MGSLIPVRTGLTCGAIEHDRRNTQGELIRGSRPGYVDHDSNPGAAKTRVVLGPGQYNQSKGSAGCSMRRYESISTKIIVDGVMATDLGWLQGGAWGVPRRDAARSVEKLVMKFKFSLMVMAAGALLLPLAVYASKTETVVKAQDKSDFAAMVAAVHQQMAPGGHWEFVDAIERRDIDSAFGDIEGLFNKYCTVDRMDKDAKVQLYADQQHVNEILTQRDSRRLVCKSERPIGSLIPKRTCRTYGTIERERQDAQQFMQRNAVPGGTSIHN